MVCFIIRTVQIMGRTFYHWCLHMMSTESEPGCPNASFLTINKQKCFRNSNSRNTVTLAYHYTNKGAMNSIKQNGLKWLITEGSSQNNWLWNRKQQALLNHCRQWINSRNLKVANLCKWWTVHLWVHLNTKKHLQTLAAVLCSIGLK